MSLRQFPLRITRPEEPGVLPVAEPVSCSLPLPAGVSTDVTCAIATDDGRAVETQASVLARWPNGSPKWILLDFALPPGSVDDSYSVTVRNGAAPFAAPLGSTSDRGVQLRSADLVVDIAPAANVRVMHQDVPVASILAQAIAPDGTTHDLRIESVALELNGAQRATALVRGCFRWSNELLLVTLRISTYAANGQIRCDLTICNRRRASHPGNYWELGDPGSVLFKQIALILRSAASGHEEILFTGPGRDWEPAPAQLAIYQESSGGPNWRSRVHVDRSGAVPLTRHGYLVEAQGRNQEGLRVQPVIQIVAPGRSWAATLLRFWEEFPSAAVARAPDEIELQLFPARFPVLHEMQGGEQKTRTCVFAHGPAETVRSVMGQILDPSFVAVDPLHTRHEVLPLLDARQDLRHDVLLAAALEGESSFEAKRERTDEYGWRNFGDLFADHESAFLPKPQEYVSHYNNQYDAIFGFGFQFLRTGDRRWWMLMDTLARHVVDIDLYHTSEDKAAYNGGMFWHTQHYVDAGKASHRSYPRAQGLAGGGPAAEHNYNAGLALHYLLTGWVPSKEAAIALGRWVVQMEDGRTTPFWWLARGDTGLASASGSLSYHGPGRAAGNSINALLTAFELTDERRYLEKAEQLIRRCINPSDDIGTLNLLDAERRWFYTVFLEALGRYLTLKNERGELDAAYDYARLSLLHFARWMREHEYPYLEKPEILEFPTETWSAQDIRKSDVLAWAALCESGQERNAYLAASKRFLDDVLTRLPRMPTFSYTRPLVLMLARGYGYYWVAERPDVRLRAPATSYSHPAPARFEPQKLVAVRRAKWLAAAGLALTALIGLAWL